MTTDSSPKPRVFVASASSGVELAYAIQSYLEDEVETVLWMESFSPGTPTFLSLFETLNSCDFALAVSRQDLGNQKLKQNLLFKLGLFVGTLSAERTFLVAPSGSQRYLPTDLRGLNLLPYDPGSSSPRVAIRAACKKLKKEIDLQGIDRTWKRAELVAAASVNKKRKKVTQKDATAKRRAQAKRSTAKERPDVFISYSHKDKKWLEKLRTLLVPSIESETVSLWDDTMIKPGDQWKEKIQETLTSVKVAVLLVSAEFLASRFIRDNELPELLDRAKKYRIKILWIYVSPCRYQVTEIANYQAAHDIAKPLNAKVGARREQEMLEICNRIIEAVQAR